MVYCTKCGTKNDDNAKSCVNCKEPLMSNQAVRHQRRQQESDCFGLPHGGAIAGLVIGLLIILWGLTSVLDIPFEFWPIIIIIFGTLMVAGAIYKMSQKR